ncbi:MAG: carboxymuconolactone decarboxylase family protein [Chloroflexi bacterium]|nr:carboxymuconolactone decarboxylase family protein [Chloroflexota bacterium]
MAWIQMIDEADARGELAEMYKRETSGWGIDHILKVHSLNPASLNAHLVVYRTLMYGKSGLSRIQREMIGTVVSALNHCEY